MGIDAWLLDQLLDQRGDPSGHQAGDPPDPSPPGAVAPLAAVLRLYRWSRPTLSLGYHQRRISPRWIALQQRGELDLVRRPSGGRAVLHGDDLCYALIWPGATGSRQQVYRRACHWLRQAFAAFDLPLHFGEPPRVQGGRAGAADPACFASQTAADLIDAGGRKRVGSAQLWRRGCLLQHGSIPLAPSPQLWRQVFGTEPPPPLPIETEALCAALQRSAEAHLLPELAPRGCALQSRELSSSERSLIARRLAAQEQHGALPVQERPEVGAGPEVG